MSSWWLALLVAYISNTNISAESNLNASDEYKVATKFLKENTDWFFDKFLAEYRKHIQNSVLTEVYIGSLQKNVPENLLSMSLSGSFNAKDVILRDMSSIYRSGPAELFARCEGYLLGNHSDITIIMSTELSLKDFQILFSYTLNFLQLHTGGSAVINVNDNSIFVEFSMVLHPTCRANLQKVRIEKMSNVEVDVTGLSIAGPIVGALSSWLVEGLLNIRRQNIESALLKALQKTSENINMCNFLPIQS